MSLKFRFIGIGVLVLALGLALSWGAMTQENILIIGTTDRITELSPANSYDYWTWHTFGQTGDALVTLKPYETTPSPSLAKSWEVSADGKAYIFYLEEGVTYTDGEPFNCETMKWSLERNLRLDGPKGGVGLIKMIKGLECLDEYTLKITLDAPDATFLARMTDGVVPAIALSPASTPADEFAMGRYAGTGPYKLIEYVPEERTVYQAYENYWGPAPKTPKVIEIFYADSAALRAAVEAGEIDVGFRTFIPDDILDLKENPNLNVIIGDTLSVRYLVFTVNMPPFDNVHVRRAIAYAVDREELNFKIFAGLNAPLYSMVPPGMWSHVPAFPKRDLGKAVEELEAAGYSTLNPLEITLWYTPKHYGTEEADVAAVLKANLEATGIIKVNVNVLEWGTYVTRMSEGALGFFLLGWYPDFIDPDNYLAPWLTEAPEGLGTFLNQATNDFDKACYDKFVELLGEAKLTTDIAERTALYEEAQHKLAECAVMIPLWLNSSAHVAVAQKNVKGIVLDASMEFRNWLIYKE